MQVCDFCKFISLYLLVIICIAVLNFVLLKVLWYTRFGLKTAHWQDLRSSSVLLLHVVWMFDVPLVRFKLLRHYSPLLPPMTWLLNDATVPWIAFWQRAYLGQHCHFHGIFYLRYILLAFGQFFCTSMRCVSQLVELQWSCTKTSKRNFYLPNKGRSLIQTVNLVLEWVISKLPRKLTIQMPLVYHMALFQRHVHGQTYTLNILVRPLIQILQYKNS